MSNTSKPLKVGLQFERDFFGVDSAEFRRLSSPTIRSLDGKSLRQLCNRKFQIGFYGIDPKKPKTQMSRYIFEEIRNLIRRDRQDKLAMYCLLGTQADSLGADMAIILHGHNKKVLIDLTTHPGKIGRGDILILQRYFFQKRDEGNSIPMNNFIQTIIDRLHPR